MVRQAEVIVRRKIEQRPALDMDMGTLRRINLTQLAIESFRANRVELLAEFLVEIAHDSLSSPGCGAAIQLKNLAGNVLCRDQECDEPRNFLHGVDAFKSVGVRELFHLPRVEVR